MAAKTKTVDAAGKIFGILEPLKPEDRGKVIQAALALLGGDVNVELGSGGGGAGSGGRTPGVGEKSYFDAKEPRTKGEELAVAARYREEREHATASTRADLERVIRAARRNFDGSNFRRDLDNARRKGLFNSGTGKDSIVLSHYGHNYVEALPVRESVKAVQKPKRAGRVRRKKGTRRGKRR